MSIPFPYRVAVVRASLLTGFAAFGCAPDLHAQRSDDYPNRPVRFVVPYPPGGNTDVFARLIGARLSERLGQQFVMDNRPGAAGTLGAAMVAHGAADGYTILMGTFGNMIVAQALNPRLGYDPLVHLTPVCSVASPPGLLVVHPSVPASSLRELIAHAKANPAKLNYASPGAGAWNHLFFELLKQRAAINLVHVPYKGIGPATVDLVAGHVQAAIASVPSSLQHVRAARLRALAVTGEARSQLLPDVPTIAESGVPGYRAAGWFAVVAPAKSPEPIVRKLNAEIVQVLQTPEMRAVLAQEGAEPNPAEPQAVARSIRGQIQQWAPVVRALGLAGSS
ncbi:MAG: tripartite tricarboxylate transporter substrate binding protein [Burkholderiales bacterium]|nr:tripartite tricarboxylate transporter substrate binding protein [Burkholderiales bacterium]